MFGGTGEDLGGFLECVVGHKYQYRPDGIAEELYSRGHSDKVFAWSSPVSFL